MVRTAIALVSGFPLKSDASRFSAFTARRVSSGFTLA